MVVLAMKRGARAPDRRAVARPVTAHMTDPAQLHVSDLVVT